MPFCTKGDVVRAICIIAQSLETIWDTMIFHMSKYVIQIWGKIIKGDCDDRIEAV